MRRRGGPRLTQAGELLFLLPMVALVATIIFFPATVAFINSFTEWNPGYESPFVGLDNYRALLTSEVFHQILQNQAILLLGVPLWILVPLLLAVLMFERVRFANLFTAIFVFPTILPATMVAIALRPALADDGFLNSLLRAVGLDSLALGWLSEPALVKPTLIVIFAWAWAGIGVLIFRSALTTVPLELLEAARVEGGRWRHEVRYVLLPGIWPSIVLYAFILVLDVFLAPFGLIFVLTSGGPGFASTTMDFDIYENAFSYGLFGVAAAEGVLLVLIIAVLAGAGLLAARVQRRRR